MGDKSARIGFVATRLSGLDGVSLEVRKWVRVLENLGYEVFFFAGESEWPADRSYIVPEAHFLHPRIKQLNDDLFNDRIRTPATSAGVAQIKDYMKQHLYLFKRRFDINLIIATNALAIPMNVPLGLAVTEFVAETSVPLIAHHHDFSWERSRYSVNAAEDYLNAAFPPTLRTVEHVVINSFAQRQLALRKGASATIVPNVMDFDSPPPHDGRTEELREVLNIKADEFFLLQPTRIVPRKRIEHAIELCRRLDLPCVLVISHKSGDEGADYERYLHDMIGLFDVEVRFAADMFGYERGKEDDGRKRYSLDDAYLAADLVTYPSAVEGFGNAFLESIF
ncbi:MAG: glycosyltransferase family 4 protein, partial [Caldilineaceae bacterium]|nr:glycosyltransferase family 4 protein [Caldilineaceae bacterium]